MSTATAVSIGTRDDMGTPVIGWLLGHTDEMTSALRDGYRFGRFRKRSSVTDTYRDQCVHAITAARERMGFKACYAPMLSLPDGQDKLGKAKLRSVGFTGAHANLSGWEMCPHRGHCTTVCVLLNGKGGLDSVRRAWVWRTIVLVENPTLWAWQIGYELGVQVRKYGRILFRPNVNTDLPWYRILPALGTLPYVTVYDYTKNPAILRDGFTAPKGFHLAYSWSERSDIGKVRAYLARGGHVAMVTDRKRSESVDANLVRNALGMSADTVTVLDADKSDEWILHRSRRGVVGDLTAKGKARRLIGRSRFVVVRNGFL